MLEKSSQTPHGRLLALFDILEDWFSAPGMQQQIGKQFSTQSNSKNLQTFLTAEAAKAGAAMPEILANQLYFMATTIINERLQPQGLSPQNIPAEAGYSCVKANIHGGLGHATFNHAKSAANALILAQTKKEFRIAKTSVYAMAASFFGALIIAGSWFTLRESSAPTTLAQVNPQAILVAAPIASPEQTAALMAQLEQMRHGNCQLIEAIQLPDSQKGIYLNMIVNGQVSTDPHEQQIAMELLKKTRCNYTPMLMANSTG